MVLAYAYIPSVSTLARVHTVLTVQSSHERTFKLFFNAFACVNILSNFIRSNHGMVYWNGFSSSPLQTFRILVGTQLVALYHSLCICSCWRDNYYLYAEGITVFILEIF